MKRLLYLVNLRFFAHSKLFILIIVYLLLSTAYNIVIPLTGGNDEYGHFRYVRFIAEHHRLPFSDADRRLASYKSRHPPLYYGLNALFFSWVKSEETTFKRIDYGHAPQHALIYEVLKQIGYCPQK